LYSLPGVHQSTVNVVRFSPNGQFMASGGDDGVVVLWSQRQRDIEFGKTEKKLAWACNRLLRGHSADVYDISWSSDSKFLVSCSMDGSAIIFNPLKGKAVQRLEGHKKTVQGCAIDPLMKFIITLSADRTARVYKTTKGKTQPQYFLHHTLKYRDYDTSPKPTASPTPMAIEKPDEDSSISSQEHHGKKSHLMFADETECCAFFRRTEWSPDGSFILLPASIYKSAPGEKPIFTVYGFTRKNLNQPSFHLPGFEKCPIGVRFCPYLFRKDPPDPTKKNAELLDLPYKMVFAIASLDVIALYTTQSILPIALIKNVHYHSITDITFSKDKYLLISSSDGYCSVIGFSEKIFGERLPISEIPQNIIQLFQDYDKIDINDISQFNKAVVAPVTSIYLI